MSAISCRPTEGGFLQPSPRLRALGWLTVAWLLVSVLLLARAYREERAAAGESQSVSLGIALLGPGAPATPASFRGVTARRKAGLARSGALLVGLIYVLAAIVICGRGASRSLALVLLSSTLCLVLLEMATRVLGLHFPALPRTTEEDHGLSVYDFTKGWFHVPGATGAVPVPGGGPAPVRINSLGLRGPEVALAKPEGAVRILVLGDSFAFGIGVDEPRLFTTLLERRLETGSSRDFEVVNLGVRGYATDQEVILFQELGVRLAPDLVILLMCDNDFEGNVRDFVYRRYYKPYFDLDGSGTLRAFNQPVPRLDRWQRVKLFMGQEYNAWNALRSRPYAPDFLQVAVPRPTGADAVRLTAALVRSLSSMVEVVGARLLVLNTGHRGEKTPLFHALRPRLEGIDQLGLEGPLERARRSAPERPWDFPADTHWNHDSHQLVAQVLARHLVRRGLLPPPDGAGGRRSAAGSDVPADFARPGGLVSNEAFRRGGARESR